MLLFINHSTVIISLQHTDNVASLYTNDYNTCETQSSVRGAAPFPAQGALPHFPRRGFCPISRAGGSAPIPVPGGSAPIPAQGALPYYPLEDLLTPDPLLTSVTQAV